MFIYDVWPGYKIIYFPFFVLITLLGVAGVLMFLSVTNARIRDIGNFMQHINRLLFYFSPVIYSVSFVPDQFVKYYFLNPVAIGLEITRYCLIQNEGVAPFYVLYYCILCLLIFFIGLVTFSKHEGMITKYL